MSSRERHPIATFLNNVRQGMLESQLLQCICRAVYQVEVGPSSISALSLFSPLDPVNESIYFSEFACSVSCLGGINHNAFNLKLVILASNESEGLRANGFIM